MRPFLSVVTRCYKRPDMLNENKASLRGQTDQDYEQLFIVDDVGRGVIRAAVRQGAPLGDLRGVLPTFGARKTFVVFGGPGCEFFTGGREPVLALRTDPMHALGKVGGHALLSRRAGEKNGANQRGQ